MGDINRCVNCGEDWIEYHVCPRTFISTTQPLAPNVSPTSEIDTLRARIAELESALAKSASREAALAEAPTLNAAYDMGATGSKGSEAERMAFEEWMRGHCWPLCAVWEGGSYRGTAEHGEYICPHAMATRRIWAAWRDRAALAKIKEAS